MSEQTSENSEELQAFRYLCGEMAEAEQVAYESILQNSEESQCVFQETVRLLAAIPCDDILIAQDAVSAAMNSSVTYESLAGSDGLKRERVSRRGVNFWLICLTTPVVFLLGLFVQRFVDTYPISHGDGSGGTILADSAAFSRDSLVASFWCDLHAQRISGNYSSPEMMDSDLAGPADEFSVDGVLPETDDGRQRGGASSWMIAALREQQFTRDNSVERDAEGAL